MMRFFGLLSTLMLLPIANAQINCTLCQDGSIPEDLDTPVFVNEGENITCGELLDAAPSRETVDECEKIQAEGVALCGCPLPEDGQSLNCTLCQDGSSVPDANLTYVEGFPCGALEQFVKSDEREGACEAYQATAGVYCNCPFDTETQNVCRICGGSTELPDPGLLVPASDHDVMNNGHTAGSVRPCSAIEFDATFFFDECSRYQQDYEAACCGGGSSATSAGNVQPSAAALASLSVVVIALV